MSLRKELPKYLAAQAAVNSLVVNRIYPVARPQDDSLPAIVVGRASGQHGHELRGSSGHAAPIFHVDCFGDSYQQVDELAEAVRGVMQGFGGTMGSVTVKCCTLDDDFDDFEAPDDGSAVPSFIIRLRYRILHDESVPSL